MNKDKNGTSSTSIEMIPTHPETQSKKTEHTFTIQLLGFFLTCFSVRQAFGEALQERDDLSEAGSNEVILVELAAVCVAGAEAKDLSQRGVAE